MYLGRFLVVGPESAAYRVSSRSFPNRTIVERGETLAVVPTDEAPETDNPYVSYTCVAPGGGSMVLGNGSHVDPIAEKLDLGYPPRDALVAGLFALDYEKDDYDTPRIAGVLGPEPFVGIVRKDALIVEAIEEPTIVATYERDRPEPYDFAAETAEAAAREVHDADFEHPVVAAGVAKAGDGYAVAHTDDR